MSTLEEEKQPKVVNILPLGKGKRILVFLADFFLNFILAFVLLNVCVAPLAKVFTGYNSRNEQYTADLNMRADILYENKILFNSGKTERNNIVYNTSYTFYCYLSYFSLDEESPSYVEFPQFGHKLENDVIRHFFVDIRGNTEEFYRLFDLYNQKDNLFDRTDDVIILKESVKELVKDYYKPGETLSPQGEKYIDLISDNLFYPLYSEVMSDINKNDLTWNGHSFVKTHANIQDFSRYFNNLVAYSSLIGVLLSSAILYLLIPILNKHHKTLSMMMLRVEKVNYKKLEVLKKSDVFVSFVYQFLMSFVIAFFVPIGLVTFYDLFNISVLLIFGLFSLMIMAASLLFLLFNGFNRSFSDYLSRSVYLTNEELDDVYRAKGYYI